MFEQRPPCGLHFLFGNSTICRNKRISLIRLFLPHFPNLLIFHLFGFFLLMFGKHLLSYYSNQQLCVYSFIFVSCIIVDNVLVVNSKVTHGTKLLWIPSEHIPIILLHNQSGFISASLTIFSRNFFKL